VTILETTSTFSALQRFSCCVYDWFCVGLMITTFTCKVSKGLAGLSLTTMSPHNGFYLPLPVGSTNRPKTLDQTPPVAPAASSSTATCPLTPLLLCLPPATIRSACSCSSPHPMCTASNAAAAARMFPTQSKTV
jgi:hypothetical protein